MSKHPSKIRFGLLGAIALGALSLSGCVVENPPRPGVDYGYVGGGYASGSVSAEVYDGAPYYYGSPYGYGGPYYYGPTYYGGSSATYVYTRDHYYPVYGRPPRHDHDHDHDHDDHDHDHDDHDHDHDGNGHHGGGYDGPGRPGRPGQVGNGPQRPDNGGGWNHDRPGRPDIQVGNSPRPSTPGRPIMGRPDSPRFNAPAPNVQRAPAQREQSVRFSAPRSRDRNDRLN